MSSYLLTSSSCIQKLCESIYVCETTHGFYRILRDVSPKGVRVQILTRSWWGGISKGLVGKGWFENWTLKDKQVFGHKGSIFVRLYPLWSIFIVISFELLEYGKKWGLESSKRHWKVLYICLPGDSDGKESACSAGGPGLIPHQQDSLEKGMAAHSSILSWRIPWTEEPGRLRSLVSQRVRHGWCDLTCRHVVSIKHRRRDEGEKNYRQNKWWTEFKHVTQKYFIALKNVIVQ